MAARAPLESGALDRAQALLARAATLLGEDLERSLPGWRSRRLALCIGTSAGGLASLEQALAVRASSGAVDRTTARRSLYDGPLEALGAFDGRVVQVLAACASSTVAIGIGARWLEAGFADLVIAGGYDALTDFVAAGFEALGATTASELAPFRVQRDGMALGEGAALVALTRANEGERAFGYVLGFATTNDAVHVTAPDPEGRGLSRAASEALSDAATPASDIDLVSAHATATLHNDRAETRALARVFGSSGSDLVVHPFKAVTGHCLGASGALEVLAALGAMREGVLPGARGDGVLEPGFVARLLPENRSGSARACLKLSSGFGGVNAALVLARTKGTGPAPERARRKVHVLAAGPLVGETRLEALERFRAVDETRLLRVSTGGALAATAVVSVLETLAPLPRDRTGVIVAASVGCIEENERFDRVRRERGPLGVEPKRFSRTSPNLPAGECAIAFGFSGPAFAVGGGPRAALQALLVASDLVALGDVDFALVVTLDEVEGVARDLFSAAGLAVPPHGARAVALGIDVNAPPLERAALEKMLDDRELPDTGATLLTRALSSAAGIGQV